MATPKHLFFATFLILASLLVSINVEAREVRERDSFSKVTNANDNVDKESARPVPNKEEALTTEESLKKQVDQDQEPTFLPQTQNGYGLYGHDEMFEDTPATTTGNRQSRTAMPDDSFYSYPNGNFENSNNYYNDRSYDRRSDNYYNKDAYVSDRREQARDTYLPVEKNFGDNARLQDSSYTTTTNTDGSRAMNNRNNYYTGGRRYGGVQQEGMSDTRFMENGKYFYDVDNEEKYYQNRYERSKPGYSTQGYYGNSNRNRNRNDNVNLYEQQFNNVDDNSMGGYQDQQEFQDSQDDEFVP